MENINKRKRKNNDETNTNTICTRMKKKIKNKNENHLLDESKNDVAEDEEIKIQVTDFLKNYIDSEIKKSKNLSKLSDIDLKKFKIWKQKLFANALELLSTKKRDVDNVLFLLNQAIHYSFVVDNKKVFYSIYDKPEEKHVQYLLAQISLNNNIYFADNVNHLMLQSPDQTFGTEIRGKQCRMCKNYNVSVEAVQTRSSDEPTSYLFTCRDCLYKWKSR